MPPSDATRMLMEIHEKIGRIESHTERLPELERRVRHLEKWRYLVIGAGVCIGFLFPELGRHVVQWAQG